MGSKFNSKPLSRSMLLPEMDELAIFIYQEEESLVPIRFGVS